MQVQVFSVSTYENRQQLEELNAFLRGHKIIDIEKQLVVSGQQAYWTFCIRYLEGSMPVYSNEKREKIDYKTILDEATFEIFSKLRQIRKQIAETDAIPAYAVFTDEELSKIAQLPIINCKNMQGIKGIGEKKIEKYGKAIAQFFLNEPHEKSPSSD